MNITLTMLKNMPSGARACNDARRWFQENFPNGGELAEVWDACPNWRWKVWFAVHYSPTVDAVAFAQSCAERAAAYAVAAVAKAADADKAAEAAAEAADEAAEAAADAADEAAVHAYNAAADAADADDANYADADVDEIQVQIAWARRILFG